MMKRHNMLTFTPICIRPLGRGEVECVCLYEITDEPMTLRCEIHVCFKTIVMGLFVRGDHAEGCLTFHRGSRQFPHH